MAQAVASAEDDALELQPSDPGTGLASPDFVKIEKNLTSLGFFTPSSNRIKNEKSKTITFSRSVDGDKVEARVTIAPSALFGLPITADQDKYLALQKIISDLMQAQAGEIKNPIGFTSAELLKLLNQADAGNNFKEVTEWLDVMTSTTIISEGAVYLAGRKTFAKDRFHIFDRAVSVGKELEPGVIADRNYVWLSDWQLENINNNYLLPIDFEIYKQLQNHIAKAFVPLLQIWLYASREDGSFEKRYDEICQILAIRQYKYLSEIKRHFVPSLDELKAHGYISAWQIEKTIDQKAYKIVFYHGEKFHRDRRRRITRKTPQEESILVASSSSHPLLVEFTRRGVSVSMANKLLESAKNPVDTQRMLEQLEWGDHLIANKVGNPIANPAGFYVYLVQQDIAVPESFETSRKRKLLKDAQSNQKQNQNQNQNTLHQKLLLEDAYEVYRRAEVDRVIAEMDPDEFERIVAEKRTDLLGQYKYTQGWDNDMLLSVALGAARAEVAKRIAFLTIESFSESQAEPSGSSIMLTNSPRSLDNELEVGLREKIGTDGHRQEKA